MDYRRLRDKYDAAFGKLRAEVCELRSITRQVSPDKVAEEAARQRVEQALAVYRECRDNLSRFLASVQPERAFAAAAGAQSGGGWTRRANRGPNDAELGQRPDIQAIAYRLWEEAGRPIGNPQEHWYRAEKLLRSEH